MKKILLTITYLFTIAVLFIPAAAKAQRAPDQAGRTNRSGQVIHPGQLDNTGDNLNQDAARKRKKKKQQPKAPKPSKRQQAQAANLSSVANAIQQIDLALALR